MTGTEWKIIQGDCRDVLLELGDGTVQTCITSPPYFGLRDYDVDGQIGLEITPAEFVAALVDVFRQVRRVLVDDGTLWLNLGDSYNDYSHHRKTGGLKDPTRKPKDLLGIPWRVAFALQDDGWFLRQDIVWNKPNPMPESVVDRCTRAHEYLFMFSKRKRYHYDAEAIREPATYNVPNSPASIKSPNGQGFTRRAEQKVPTGWDTGPGAYGTIHRQGRTSDKQRGHSRRHAGFNDRWDSMTRAEQSAMGRNKRSVWTVATRPFKEAHFATFPAELIMPCVMASAPAGSLVLDPFAGSGTTGVVAVEQGRNFYGCELNPEYAEMSRRRIQDAARQPRLIA